MKKKILTMLLAFGLVATACSNKTPEEKADNNASADNKVEATSEKSDDNTSSDDVVTIDYWYAFADKIGENNTNLVEKFNSTVGKEKNIVVNAEYQANYADLHQKLQAAHVAGTVPAVTVMEISAIKAFADNNVIEPLSPYIERDGVDMDDFFEGLLVNCNVDGTWYGVPYLRSTPILYMNTTLLEQAGLDPKGPETWDEFGEYCKTIKEKTGKYGFTMFSYSWVFEGFMLEHGSSVLNETETATNINSPEGKEIFTFFKDLIDKDYVRWVAGGESSKVDADIMNQNTAMWMNSTANLTQVMAIAEDTGFEVNTAFLPKKVQHGVPTGGCNLIMTAEQSDEKKEAAWEFIKWMSEPEQAAYASAHTGYVPSRKSAAETDTIKELYEKTPQFKVALDQLELYSTGRPMNPGYTEVMTLMTNLMDGILINDMDIDTSLADFEQKANGILK